VDYDSEITSLAAETIALQAIVCHVLYRIGQSNPAISEAIRLGFDDAANQVETLAISAGTAARPDHLVKALSIVEQLRSIAVANQGTPKHHDAELRLARSQPSRGRGARCRDAAST
jgi:hypothetical protein